MTEEYLHELTDKAGLHARPLTIRADGSPYGMWLSYERDADFNDRPQIDVSIALRLLQGDLRRTLQNLLDRCLLIGMKLRNPEGIDAIPMEYRPRGYNAPFLHTHWRTDGETHHADFLLSSWRSNSHAATAFVEDRHLPNILPTDTELLDTCVPDYLRQFTRSTRTAVSEAVGNGWHPDKIHMGERRKWHGTSLTSLPESTHDQTYTRLCQFGYVHTWQSDEVLVASNWQQLHGAIAPSATFGEYGSIRFAELKEQ